ncbi:hypothetical protein LPB142_10765 [Rhodobacter xanthinilyticus]|uniref:Uncharacterized protein n=1 Tax=Rhodobacter xanthinilyticus TaxID=1850250 RepID=A0A1D9MD14_9RHOB|nr:hypothetical protein LPB142_10765 [Rhodobacter xanthinilyticus]
MERHHRRGLRRLDQRGDSLRDIGALLLGAKLEPGERHHRPGALILQDLLHAADRKPLFMQQFLDAAEEHDIIGAVIAPPARALHRLDLGKAAFPESQHMGGRFQQVGDLGNRAECFG